ncbi:helix-turn-helix domain-containing protein [Blastococcus carthaginiensis]|uniref:helix-turn-helix domain-containing protein n=1 Tax=Blastococcus carthaginiensis TaxID=3050034 RepID=UPI00387365E8
MVIVFTAARGTKDAEPSSRMTWKPGSQAPSCRHQTAPSARPSTCPPFWAVTAIRSRSPSQDRPQRSPAGASQHRHGSVASLIGPPGYRLRGALDRCGPARRLWQTQHKCCGKSAGRHGRLLSVPDHKSSRHVALSDGRRQALGAKVRGARQHAQMTQELLAQGSGVGAEHIQRIERGVANPTLATLFAIADALRVTARDLLPD